VPYEHFGEPIFGERSSHFRVPYYSFKSRIPIRQSMLKRTADEAEVRSTPPVTVEEVCELIENTCPAPYAKIMVAKVRENEIDGQVSGCWQLLCDLSRVR
jgi:hypothetical protein